MRHATGSTPSIVRIVVSVQVGRRTRRLRESERPPLALATMKIQVLSDLHLEHGGPVPEHHPEADVIVLAGDLAPYTKGLVAKLSEFWASAPHILYVLGNHEFYGWEIDDARARLADECEEAGIHLLDPGMVRIESTRFIGATLWTDLALYGKADESGAHRRLRRGISDFAGAIRHHGGTSARGSPFDCIGRPDISSRESSRGRSLDRRSREPERGVCRCI